MYVCLYEYICVYICLYMYIDVLRANTQTQTQEEVSAIRNMVHDQLEDVQKHFGKQVQNGSVYIYLKMCERVRACVYLKSSTNVQGDEFNRTVRFMHQTQMLSSIAISSLRAFAFMFVCIYAYTRSHM